MPAYDYGNTSLKYAPGSKEYSAQAAQFARGSMGPARKQALEELNDEMSGRGLSQSGLALKGKLGVEGRVGSKLGENIAEIGGNRANVLEKNRQALQGRGWEVEDRNLGAAFSSEMSEQERAAKEAQIAGKLQSGIWGGIGSLGGALASSYGGGSSAPELPAVDSDMLFQMAQDNPELANTILSLLPQYGGGVGLPDEAYYMGGNVGLPDDPYDPYAPIDDIGY
jgi:hypothetical protein